MDPKSLKEIHPAGAQVEESDEGRLDMLFGVNQATEVDARQSTCACLQKLTKTSFEASWKG